MQKVESVSALSPPHRLRRANQRGGRRYGSLMFQGRNVTTYACQVLYRTKKCTVVMTCFIYCLSRYSKHRGTQTHAVQRLETNVTPRITTLNNKLICAARIMMQRRNELFPSWITLILEVCQKARSVRCRKAFFVSTPPSTK